MKIIKIFSANPTPLPSPHNNVFRVSINNVSPLTNNHTRGTSEWEGRNLLIVPL